MLRDHIAVIDEDSLVVHRDIELQEHNAPEVHIDEGLIVVIGQISLHLHQEYHHGYLDGLTHDQKHRNHLDYESKGLVRVNHPEV